MLKSSSNDLMLNEIKVIRIPLKAVEELLLESAIDRFSDFFGYKNQHKYWVHMIYVSNTGELIYASNPMGKEVDFDYLLENVPITTDSLYKSNPYSVIRTENGVIRVIRVTQTAIKELLWETIMEKGEEYFETNKDDAVKYGMIWDEETGDLLYAAFHFSEAKQVDYDFLIKTVPITTESLYKPNRYITIKGMSESQ